MKIEGSYLFIDALKLLVSIYIVYKYKSFYFLVSVTRNKILYSYINNNWGEYFFYKPSVPPLQQPNSRYPMTKFSENAMNK